MRVKVEVATIKQLGYLVAQIETHAWAVYDHAMYTGMPPPRRPSEYLRDNGYRESFSPATDWAQGGPIIEREKISVQIFDASFKPSDLWNAYTVNNMPINAEDEINGPTPLIAAMRCYVSSKLGNEVEIPDELL